MPVLAVDRVNRTPTGNAPDLARLMPPIPPATHFDVAAVKPSNPLGPRLGTRIGGGTVTLGVFR